MTRTVLIDWDIVAYRCGFAAEHTTYIVKAGDVEWEFPGKRAMNEFIKESGLEDYSWSSELTVEPLRYVLGTVKRMISNIVKGCKADEHKIYLSDKSNHRHVRATIQVYKGIGLRSGHRCTSKTFARTYLIYMERRYGLT